MNEERAVSSEGSLMTPTHFHLERFYAALARLEEGPNQGLTLEQLIASKGLPERGVYFLSKPGEMTSDRLGAPRIVRVGTHAVSAGSKATLRSRLKIHLGGRSGLGNHRGSIFRLHVGNAMLRRDGETLPTWGVGPTAPPELRADPCAQEAEAALERRVSAHIGRMTVLWVSVPDWASPTSLRAVIERNSIALLSNRRSPIKPASEAWLGLSSHREEVRKNLLWNLRHVDDDFDGGFFTALEAAVERSRCL